MIPKMRIALTGDVMLGRLVAEAIKEFGPNYPFGDTTTILKKCDLTIVNLECVISDKGKPVSPKTFHFRAPPQAINTLKNAGIDIVTLANNHVLDFGKEAFLDMLERLNEAGISYTGAGRDEKEAKTPIVVNKKLKIGVMALTDNEPGWEVKEHKRGIWFVPVDTKDVRFNELIHQIKKIKKKVDFLIVSAHVGSHFREKPDKEFIEFTHAILSAGAHLYFGHSNHAFQGIEIYKGKTILYDTGDFVDDYAVDEIFRNDRSFIFILELEEKRVRRISLIPTQIDNFQVNLATSEEGDWTISRMEKLCENLGTKTFREENQLRIDLQP